MPKSSVLPKIRLLFPAGVKSALELIPLAETTGRVQQMKTRRNMHDELRSIPLLSVLDLLGLQSDYKTRKGGTEWFGACPIHQAKTNKTSFSFDASGKFFCFSCSAKGRGAIDLIMAVRKVGFQEAVKLLSDFQPERYAQVPQPPPEVHSEAKSSLAENQPFKGSYEKFYVPSDWLRRRGLLKSTLDEYQVGEYDNPKRQSAYKGKILLPIRRFTDGELVAYLARTPEPKEGEPKYIWPKNFHKSLEVYGAYRLKEKAPIRVLYLVESPFAVLKFYQLGLPAVSPFGWSLSDQQIQIIASIAKGVVYLPDTNKQSDIADSLRRLALHAWVKSPSLPDGITDPESLTLDQIRALA